MRKRGVCILLALLLSLSSFCAVAFAASDEPSATASSTASASAKASAKSESVSSAERDASDSDDPEAEPSDDEESGESGGVGSGLPQGAAPYDSGDGSELPQGAAPYDPEDGSEDDDESLTLTTIGDGTLYVLQDDEIIELQDWVDTVEFPVEDVQFVAVPDNENEALTGVMVDGERIPFEEVSDEDYWEFTVDSVPADAEIVVSFGGLIPAAFTMYGGGEVSVLQGDQWQQISEEEPEFEAQDGTTLRILASPAQSGYAASFITVDGTDLGPVMYAAAGTVFEVPVEGPYLDIEVRFLEYGLVDVEIEGKGQVDVCSDDDSWVAVENGAKIPFEPGSITDDDPLTFRGVPADGYSLSGARYASYPLILTKLTEEEAAAMSLSGKDVHVFTLPDPDDTGLLRVTFLASGDSQVQWLRGSDTTTGISWAVPLGTSSYGVSNVSEGSSIKITQLQQGQQGYEQARSLAARFGSAFVAWDFSLVNAEGVAYKPTVPVLFSLPIPNGFPRTAQGLRMLHILSDGQVTENPLEIRTDAATGIQYIYMRVESLSTFVLVNAGSGTSAPTAVPTYYAGTGTGTYATPVPTAPVATAVPTAVPTASSPRTDDTGQLAGWWLAAFAAGVLVCCAALLRRRAQAR